MNYLNLAKGSRRDYQILYPPSRSNRLDGLSCLLDNFDLESSDGRVQQTFLSAGEQLSTQAGIQPLSAKECALYLAVFLIP